MRVRIQRVLVNVLAGGMLRLTPGMMRRSRYDWRGRLGKALEVYIANSLTCSWPVALLPLYSRSRFTTSKAVGLGIGLSISVSRYGANEGRPASGVDADA